MHFDLSKARDRLELNVDWQLNGQFVQFRASLSLQNRLEPSTFLCTSFIENCTFLASQLCIHIDEFKRCFVCVHGDYNDLDDHETEQTLMKMDDGG